MDTDRDPRRDLYGTNPKRMTVELCPTCGRDDNDPMGDLCSNPWHIRDRIESVTYEGTRFATAMTVDEFLRRYLAWRTGLEPGTVTRYRSYVERDIRRELGHLALADLSRDDIAAWIRRMTARGSSGKTVKNKRDFLTAALSQAVDDGLIPSNPCQGVALPRWDRAEMVTLTRLEFRQLADATPDYWRPMIEFLVASGARWSEVTALKPADIDQAAGTVRINKAWKAGGHLGATKTKRSNRTINVAPKVLAQLDYSGEWLFTNSGRGHANPGGPVRASNFTKNVWRPAIHRSELTKRPRVHDLRHTCASWMIQAGIPMPVVQAHLGHESINTTVSIYVHLDRTAAARAADAIGEMLA